MEHSPGRLFSQKLQSSKELSNLTTIMINNENENSSIIKNSESSPIHPCI